MKHGDSDIDLLIGKVLSGEAEPMERAVLDQWVSDSVENEKYFQHCQLIFEKSNSIKYRTYDTDRAWQNVRARLETSKVKSMRPSGEWPRKLFRIAATLLLVCITAYVIYRLTENKSTNEQVIVAGNQVVDETLPNGSGIWLNKQSRISYSFNKKQNAHMISLQGEAYFEIVKKDSKEVIVEVDGIMIKDIGTKFNVRAHKDSTLIIVTVDEGEVRFYSPTDSGLVLRANGTGVYDRKTRLFSVGTPVQNPGAYAMKRFTFNHEKLGEVARQLNEVYDVKLIIDPRASACPVTVDFNNDQPEEIAEVLAETLGLTVEKRGSTIRLTGDGCNQH